MPRRAPQTAADYLAVAVCPVLIGLLIASLMWFLVKVFLNGEFVALWVMSFFVLGIVAVSRMAMEEGYSRASLFGAALALALGIVLPPKFWPVLALVWWAAYRLTWDCTLIDDTQDASGEGLLQHMGLDPAAPPAGSVPPGTTMPAGELEATTTAEPPRERSWWDLLLEPDRRPHAPGVWVVYFSLAALPLFGIGGWFVTDPDTRSFVFRLLVLYVACGMALLLATSFLGLRRYLRQRRLQMPLEMTTTWIAVGLLMIVSMLVLATILPRPSREHSISQLPFAANNLFRRASQFAVRDKGIRDDDAKNVAQADAQKDQTTDRTGGGKSGKSNSQQPSESSGKQKSPGGQSGSAGKGEAGKSSGESSKSQSSSSGDKGKSGQSKSSSSSGDESKGRNAEADSNQKSRDDSRSNEQPDTSPSRQEQNQQQNQQQNQPQNQQANQQSPPSSPDPSQQQDSPSRSPSTRPSFNPLSALMSALSPALKVLFYVALAIGLVVAAWMYRDELWTAWQKLMEELHELWDSWFGKKPTAADIAATMDVAAPPRTFASYRDPFLTGDAHSMSWPQLVRYTFEALEAWGREHACPRASGQTAYEFAIALSTAEPQIGPSVQALAGWYSQLAYAPRATAGSPDVLRQLWHDLSSRRSTPAAA